MRYGVSPLCSSAVKVAHVANAGAKEAAVIASAGAKEAAVIASAGAKEAAKNIGTGFLLPTCVASIAYIVVAFKKP